MITKECALCFAPFTAYRSALRFCTLSCAAKANAHKKPQNTSAFTYTVEMFREAEQYTPQGDSRARYISNKFGGTTGTVLKGRIKLGYKWERRKSRPLNRGCAWYFRKFVAGIGCCLCAEQRATEAAHIIGINRGGPDDLDNILPFCPTHHTLFDRNLLNPQELERLSYFSMGPLLFLRQAFIVAKTLNFGKPKKGRKITISEKRENQARRKTTLLGIQASLPPVNEPEHLWMENSIEKIQEEIKLLPYADESYIPWSAARIKAEADRQSLVS